jgi:hypothetical protein
MEAYLNLIGDNVVAMMAETAAGDLYPMLTLVEAGALAVSSIAAVGSSVLPEALSCTRKRELGRDSNVGLVVPFGTG